MKKPLIIIIVTIVIIGAGVGIYFVTQGSKTENVNQSTNSVTNSISNTNNAAMQDNTYIGDDFSILKPADWTQSQISGTLVSFHNTSEVHPEGSAAKKINFQSYLAVSFDMANERSLAEINDLTIDQIKASIPSAEVTASSDETVDGQPAKFNILTLNQQEVDYTVFIAVISKGDKYYAISGNTTTDKWTDYKDMFYETARSFVFKD
ncbi:MAG: PsbP-related protein [Patescibacteria group bacterium]